MSELAIEQPLDTGNTDLPELDTMDRDQVEVANVDILKQYLREVRQYPLLTADQEVVLGHTIQAGLRATEQLSVMPDVDDPTAQISQAELAAQMSDGQRAQHSLTTANLRLVVRIASRYKTSNPQFMDLIQDGNEELLQTTTMFNPDLGYKFSTYATPRIFAAIQKSSRELRTTGLLVNDYMVRSIDRVNTRHAALQQELGREPTLEELRVAAKLTEKRFGSLMKNITLMNVGSLDAPITESTPDEADAWSGQVPADQPEVIDIIMYRQLREKTARTIASLSEFEQEVIRLRHGFGGGEGLTRDEIGKVFGISRDNVRIIENRAFDKLRASLTLDELRDFRTH